MSDNPYASTCDITVPRRRFGTRDVILCIALFWLLFGAGATVGYVFGYISGREALLHELYEPRLPRGVHLDTGR